MLCMEQTSQIQALDRTQPILPVRPGLPERATHDYKRKELRPCLPLWRSQPAPLPAGLALARIISRGPPG